MAELSTCHNITAIKDEPVNVFNDNDVEPADFEPQVSATVTKNVRSPDATTVKHEMDIGLTVLQPPDIHFTLRPCKHEPADKTPQTAVNVFNNTEDNSSGTKSNADETHSEVTDTNNSMSKPGNNTSVFLKCIKANKEPTKFSDKCTHPCLICGERYLSDVYLKKHMRRVHTEQKPYHCIICKTSYRYASVLAFHYKSKHRSPVDNDKVFYCDICNRRYTSKERLKTHLTLKRDAFGCGDCDKSFHHKRYLRTHITLYHKWQCNSCDEKFIHKFMLDEHVRQHLTDGTLRCYYCENVCVPKDEFRNNDDIVLHASESRSTAGSEEQLSGDGHSSRSIAGHIDKPTCDICQKTLMSNADLARQSYQCDICKSTFVLKEFLRAHIKQHESRGRYKCMVCHISYIRKDKFSKHILTHDKTYYCEHCSLSFRDGDSLARHNLHHMPGKQWTCPHCRKQWPSKKTLKTHIKSHTYSRLCPECGISLPSLDKLKDHVKLHAVPRSLSCELCGQSCPSVDEMNMHYVTCAGPQLNESTARRSIPLANTSKAISPKIKKEIALEHTSSVEAISSKMENLDGHDTDCKMSYLSFGDISDLMEHECRPASDATHGRCQPTEAIHRGPASGRLGAPKTEAAEETPSHSIAAGFSEGAGGAETPAPAPVTVHVVPAEVMQRLLRLYQQRAGT